MKYKRMKQHAFLGGICSGLAYTFNMQTWIVRLIVLICAWSMIGLGLYLLVWWLAPQYQTDPSDYAASCE